MSGENIKAHAGVAEGTGTAHGPEVEVAHRGRLGGVAGPRSILSAGASKGRSAKSAHYQERVLRLVADGLSTSQICLRLAIEDGRHDEDGEIKPYDPAQVRRWKHSPNS